MRMEKEEVKGRDRDRVRIKVRIEVKGDKALLYVHGNAQPTLIVNDLRLGAQAKGRIALWIGPGTIAHFANVRIGPS